MCRKPSTIFIFEAWYEGTAELNRPTNPAVANATHQIPNVICKLKKLTNCGE